MWRRVRYVLVLTALCAIATCPSAHRSCRARLRAREAPQLLDVLSAELMRIVNAGGAMPSASAGPTPSIDTCCQHGGSCAPDPQLWNREPWRALRFSMDRPHRYSVEYLASSTGPTIRVIGDVDCDGVLASYQVRATVVGKAVRFERSSTNPLE
jgi:hypothetical protein